MDGSSVSETSDHVSKNRLHWEGQSATYQAANARQLDRWDRLAWGVWDGPRTRSPRSGTWPVSDALEYGCGACQFGIKVACAGRASRASTSRWAAPPRPHQDGRDRRAVPGRAGRRRTDPVPRRELRPGVLRPRCDGVRRSLPNRSRGRARSAPGRSLRLQWDDAVDLGRMGRGGPATVPGDAARLLRAWEGGARRSRVADHRVPADLRRLDPSLPRQRVRGRGPDRAPAAGRCDTTYVDYAPLEWARAFPSEHIWKVRKAPDAGS